MYHLSIPLNGFEVIQYAIDQANALGFQFHWMDSGSRGPSQPCRAYHTSFNSIEWIPQGIYYHPLLTYTSFNSIEWIHYIDLSGRGNHGVGYFQFHWMDSQMQSNRPSLADELAPFNSTEWIRAPAAR